MTLLLIRSSWTFTLEWILHCCFWWDTVTDDRIELNIYTGITTLLLLMRWRYYWLDLLEHSHWDNDSDEWRFVWNITRIIAWLEHSHWNNNTVAWWIDLNINDSEAEITVVNYYRLNQWKFVWNIWRIIRLTWTFLQ